MATKKRKKRGASKRAKARSYKQYILPAAIIFGVICLLTYGWIDSRVRRRLVASEATGLSAVYSSAIEFAEGRQNSCEAVVTALKNRNYAEIDHPKLSGEFRYQGNTIEIITREFQHSESLTEKSRHINYNCETGSERILLEPVALAPLGRTEFRASSYRKLSQIPRSLHDAIIAIEDRRFYRHHGIDLYGIIRATLINLKAMRLVQGGSTLTQQLAKITLFTSKKSFLRKILELPAAFSIERYLSKSQIFERYINEIYLGQEGPIAIHGVQEASRSFFGKDVEDLTISQSALLAGMIQAPSAYSPRRNFKRAIARRNVVLKAMLDEKFISETKYKSALNEKIQIIKQVNHKRTAPYYTATLQKLLQENNDLSIESSDQIKVFSGIDLELQQCAEKAVLQGRKRIEGASPALRRRRKQIEIALLAVEPSSGIVKSWVGGVDYGTNQYDHVFNAKRQIGSTIKPFLYLTAIDPSLNEYKAATTISVLSDEPTGIKLFSNKTWVPENYDKQFRGDVTLRYALERSLNIPAVYVAQRVGIPALVNTAKKFRLADDIPEVPALALGAVDTTLYQLTASFAAIANRGVYTTLRPYLKVIDHTNRVLAETTHSQLPITDEAPIYILTDILRGVIERGTATVIRSMGYKGVAAGKTGTSDETRDAWFVGYTPNIVVGVWSGLDDNSKTGLTGSTASAPVWADFMNCAAPFIENKNFVPSPEVSFVKIDRESRKLATEFCPSEETIEELFLNGTEPLDYCSIHD